MSNKYHQRHALHATYATKSQPNQWCNYINGWTGERCFAPTESGATYCKHCKERLAAQSSGSRYAGVRSVGKWSHMS